MGPSSAQIWVGGGSPTSPPSSTVTRRQATTLGLPSLVGSPTSPSSMAGIRRRTAAPRPSPLPRRPRVGFGRQAASAASKRRAAQAPRSTSSSAAREEQVDRAERPKICLLPHLPLSDLRCRRACLRLRLPRRRTSTGRA
uniref:Uncharacterized protein n=1 Tax=Arundo donax TaxID=35708 RepID=A0A0A9C1U6_ARUDO